MNTTIPTTKAAPAAASALDGVDRLILSRQRRAVTQAGYISLLGRIAIIALAAYIIFTQLFIIIPNSGNGMFPAVKDGDLLIGYRIQESFVQDDIIIYEKNGTVGVGRVAARAGDLVNIGTDGIIMVNGTNIAGEIMYPTYAKENIIYPYTVPEGCVFVLGDYRTQTTDSRDFGPVKYEEITAKVITVLRRRGL